MSSISAKISLLDVNFFAIAFLFFCNFDGFGKSNHLNLSIIFGACCLMADFNLLCFVITHASVVGCLFSAFFFFCLFKQRF